MAFFCVTGLQYAGGKTLFDAARKYVEESPKYVFYDPVKAGGAAEEGKTAMTEEEFNDQKDAGQIFAAWKVGLINYGIHEDAVAIAEGGKTVVVVVPREQVMMVEKALQKADEVKFTIINLQVDQDMLVERGKVIEEKFNEKNFRNKIKKFEDLRGDNVVKIDNEGTIEEGVEEFKKAIGFDPLLDIPPKPKAEDAELDLKTCSPQDYLKATLYPALYPAMTKIQMERPGDPIEYLAFYLYAHATTTKKREKELLNLKAVKASLREKLKKEYTVIGRI